MRTKKEKERNNYLGECGRVRRHLGSWSDSEMQKASTQHQHPAQLLWGCGGKTGRAGLQRGTDDKGRGQWVYRSRVRRKERHRWVEVREKVGLKGWKCWEGAGMGGGGG